MTNQTPPTDPTPDCELCLWYDVEAPGKGTIETKVDFGNAGGPQDCLICKECDEA